MNIQTDQIQTPNKWYQFPRQEQSCLFLSILIQLILALCFGHIYDMRIFMATGYLVGTGQNPYLAQDLSAVFHNPAFHGITTFGYPPPWSFVLGIIYLLSYKVSSNFLIYNLAIKLPIIVANIALAYLVRFILGKIGVQESISRNAWIFLLFNPFLLCVSSAWGQFDSVVALLILLSIYLLSEGKVILPATLLALAISIKPIALPIIPVAFVYLASNSKKRLMHFLLIFTIFLILLCIAPFSLLHWDPSPILQHWNAHFSVGGGLSFMTFLEYLKGSYQLSGLWWITGWLWFPAICLAIFILKPAINEFKDLLNYSVAMLLVFFLCRAWTSETNIILLLPLIVILFSINELDKLSISAIWVLPLLFSFFNASIAQLFFPTLPNVMNDMIRFFSEFSTPRYIIRTIIVSLWLISGWRIIFRCYKNNISHGREKIPT